MTDESELTNQFRKKPVVIEAYCYDQKRENYRPDWFQDRVTRNEIVTYEYHALIHTLEGTMRADLGDWIIKGVKGEVYPCKPDIFAATYEPVARPAPVTDESELKPVAWERRFRLRDRGWASWEPISEEMFARHQADPYEGREERALYEASALVQLQQRVADLEQERDALRAEWSKHSFEAIAAETRAEASEAKVRAMQEALTAFTAAAGRPDAQGVVISWGFGALHEAYQLARAALANQESPL